MKKIKQIKQIVILSILIVSFLISLSGCGQKIDDTTLRVISMKGPTTIGLLPMMKEAENDSSKGNYEFQMAKDVNEILPKIVKEEVDIALVPANVASVLYQKTEGDIQVIDINTLGVLYMVSKDTSIQEIKDLQSKTIYLTGKGTIPDCTIKYLLESHNIGLDECKLEFKSEPTEVVAMLAEDPNGIGVLPQPFVTVACAKNQDLQVVLDLNEEWRKTQENQKDMVTGVTIARTDFLTEHKDAVNQFLKEHLESTKCVNEDPATAAVYAVEAKIIPNESIGEKAIPKCNVTCITGKEMKETLSDFLSVLYERNPKLVGGEIPNEDFYYVP